ncbi:MAG: hypothetical protein V4813_16820 [Gemmatimonadota bacterium]
MKFSQALAEHSPFRAREFIAGKDAVTLARDILSLDQAQFSAAFRKSPMKRAKLAGLRRNAAVALRNVDTFRDTAVRPPCGMPPPTNFVRMTSEPVSITVRPLHSAPDAGLSGVGTAVSRLALVATLTTEAWALAGHDLPTYARADAPVVVSPLRPTPVVRERRPEC